MIRSLFLLGIYLAFLAMGVAAPFVFTLGYVWVDTFRPQAVALMVLNQLPVALIMGLAAIAGYLLMDRRFPPRFTLASGLIVSMAIWSTVTMLWAESSLVGWLKWDWAFKAVLFAAFIPFVIRSRIQIEAFIQVYIFSLAGNLIPFGVKTLISGGGYGRNLGLENGNSNLAEGGQLSTLCLMAIPLCLFLVRHAQCLPRTTAVRLGYLGLCGLALATALGTFERSALIGLLVLAVFLFVQSRHKVAFLVVAVLVGGVILQASPEAWMERMSTIQDATQEHSANSRLLVWQWTLDYAKSHPLGGGFGAYVVSRIEYPDGTVVFGRAFHSIWFEVLGEQGWIGLGLFVLIGGASIVSLLQVICRSRGSSSLSWCADLAKALVAGFMTFFASGTFVGIAFQPMFWYFVALSICLREYVRRAESLRDFGAHRTYSASRPSSVQAALLR